jgi:peptide/nickel transport system ATP-binding protein
LTDLLLKVHELQKIFPVKAGAFAGKSLMLKAVDGVSFDLRRGETLGLVGESGCGKTTVGRCLIRIYEADGGRVFVDPDEATVAEILTMDRKIAEARAELEAMGKRGNGNRELKAEMRSHIAQVKQLATRADLLSMPRNLLKQNRKRIQMVFQDPWASLNPRMLVKDIVGEGPKEFGTHRGRELEDMVYSILEKVGLPSVAAMRYPHEFSGGQRQRIGIARALALMPSLIICDEPVSALDVSIQAQILNLLISLQEEFQLTLIFIAHDLSVVQYVSDRIAVMYLGKIMEIADAGLLSNAPRHPYTISLLSAVPVADPDGQPEEVILEGDVPSPVNPPGGCPFHPRCPNRIKICTEIMPNLVTEEDGRSLACHNPSSH